MSALLLLVKTNDNNKTEEVYLEDGSNVYSRSYFDTLGTNSGFDGDFGGTYYNVYALVNVGNTTAKNVVINKQSTNQEFFILQHENKATKSNKLALPDIDPGKSCAFRIITTIPKNTGELNGTLTLTTEYVSEPGDIDIGNYYRDAETIEHPNIEICTHIEDLDLHGGRPYGEGPYDGPLAYGQEGVYKITREVSTLLPIGGSRETVLLLSFSTKQRYRGTELTIEEIQSSSTSAYMNLDCFDGPMLPLYLGYTPDEDI